MGNCLINVSLSVFHAEMLILYYGVNNNDIIKFYKQKKNENFSLFQPKKKRKYK